MGSQPRSSAVRQTEPTIRENSRPGLTAPPRDLGTVCGSPRAHPDNRERYTASLLQSARVFCGRASDAFPDRTFRERPRAIGPPAGFHSRKSYTALLSAEKSATSHNCPDPAPAATLTRWLQNSSCRYTDG